MPRMTGGEALIEALKVEGVETVFGIPGHQNLDIYDALARQDEIRHVLARHEEGVGYMADGYARVTGRPGVGITTTGPGGLNMMSALGEAYADDDLRSHIRNLPAQQRAAIILRYYEDLTEAQTAEVLGISVGTVKSHTSRALNALRITMKEVTA